VEAVAVLWYWMESTCCGVFSEKMSVFRLFALTAVRKDMRCYYSKKTCFVAFFRKKAFA